jgi:peptide/nickel transport system substrate-binding protein
MRRQHISASVSALVLFAVACGGAAQPAATRAPAPAAPTATRASAASQPTATSAPAAPEPTRATAATAAPTKAPAAVTLKGKVIIAISSFGNEDVDPVNSRLATEVPHLQPIAWGLVRNGIKQLGEGAFQPSLATRYESNQRADEWTFYLNRAPKFHNGEPVNADAFILGIGRLLGTVKQDSKGVVVDAKASNKVFLQKLIKDVVKVDDYTIRIVLTRPDFFPPRAGLAPTAPKFWQEKGENEQLKGSNGTGPYRLTEHVRGERFVLEAVPDFFEKSHQAKVKTIVQLQSPEPTTRLAMLQTGEADLTDNLSTAQLIEVRRNTKLKEINSPEAYIYHLDLGDAMRGKKETPVTNLKVRQAISLAIDRKGIVERILSGLGGPNPGQFLFSYHPGYDPNLVKYEFNPAKARQLLAEAGFKPGQITLQMNIMASEQKATFEAVAVNLEDVGIKINIVALEKGTHYGKYRDGTIGDLAAFGMVGYTGYDPVLTVETYGICGATYSGWCNKGYDELYNKANSVFTIEERAKYVAQAEKLAYEQLARIPVVSTDAIFVATTRVKSWLPQPGHIFTANLETIELAE